MYLNYTLGHKTIAEHFSLPFSISVHLTLVKEYSTFQGYPFSANETKIISLGQVFLEVSKGID